MVSRVASLAVTLWLLGDKASLVTLVIAFVGVSGPSILWCVAVVSRSRILSRSIVHLVGRSLRHAGEVGLLIRFQVPLRGQRVSLDHIVLVIQFCERPVTLHFWVVVKDPIVHRVEDRGTPFCGWIWCISSSCARCGARPSIQVGSHVSLASHQAVGAIFQVHAGVHGLLGRGGVVTGVCGRTSKVISETGLGVHQAAVGAVFVHRTGERARAPVAVLSVAGGAVGLVAVHVSGWPNGSKSGGRVEISEVSRVGVSIFFIRIAHSDGEEREGKGQQATACTGDQEPAQPRNMRVEHNNNNDGHEDVGNSSQHGEDDGEYLHHRHRQEDRHNGCNECKQRDTCSDRSYNKDLGQGVSGAGGEKPVSV